ncbi:hypothetical protein ENSA5_24620 [Enhygromyxa salina]|uniref:Cytochrome c domain-containing protein n=1 Tax=Enhygromyxa salina TaxID=215803 RepID=A0A2S9YB30_9BACT|nr:hypothetical protein [Enhygromyxa salina]PRQ02309.1 hypothetical protein ENSA5_24620 [Enhygromyxa salina]
MKRNNLICLSIGAALTLGLPTLGCTDDGAGDSADTETGDGDGDGDTGDGDGDTGDGDGDPGDGDGDTGDGDGDTGDGDGDTGDGDGDTGDGDGDTGDGDGDGELSFEADVYPIIALGCSCHVVNAPGGLALTDADTAYANLVDVPSSQEPDLNRVTPGDGENSYLYQKISATQAGLSPQNAQMPKTPNQELSAMPLSDADQMTILDWIAAGAAP